MGILPKVVMRALLHVYVLILLTDSSITLVSGCSNPEIAKSNRGRRFRERRALRRQNEVGVEHTTRRSSSSSRIISALTDIDEGLGYSSKAGTRALSLDPNEGAKCYDCSQLASEYGIEVGETLLDNSCRPSVSFMGFDDLFPNTGLADVFDESADFRSAIRMSTRHDFTGTNNDRNNMERRFRRHDSGKDSMMEFWLDDNRKKRKDLVFTELTKVFEEFLPRSGLDGDAFMFALMGLCGDTPQFGSWMDIIGVLDKSVVHAWHQDSGLSHRTVMVGFPPSNRYEGIGVFSHVVKLSNRLPEPRIRDAETIPGPRTWPLHEMLLKEGSRDKQNRSGSYEPVASGAVLRLQFQNHNIIRPLYKKGKEIMIYDDSHIFHSAPDFSRRESLWRFM